MFTNDKPYNGFNIILQSLKLENSSNVACLYNELGKISNSEKNILSIFIDGCSINLSIVNKRRNLYKVKDIESAAFGENDFTDNYIGYCLRNLGENLNDKFLKSPSLLYQLRKAIILWKRNFNIIPQTLTEIIIQNEENNNSQNSQISILLRKTDFENSCDEFFKKINLLIKNVLNKSGLTEIDIDDIIIIGQTASSSKIKSILKEIFKNNQKLNKISSFSNSNDYLISISCALQIMNKNEILSSKYIFTDISPYSLGIESINGLMDFVIQKGQILPYKNKKLIKISNKNENICINFFEGEQMLTKNNKFIASAVIEKGNFKEIINKDYVEVYVQLEIDCDYNLKCYIFEPKSNDKYECLININVF